MAGTKNRTEAQTAFVCESELISGSSALNSIEGIDIESFVDGATCYARISGLSYRWNETSMAAPTPGEVILPAQLVVGQPGRWLLIVAGGGGGGAVDTVSGAAGVAVAPATGNVVVSGAALYARNGSNGPMTAVVNFGGFAAQSLANPTNPQDAATKSYVDTAVAGIVTPTLANVLTAGNNAGALKITNLANPTVAQDAATKFYVDAGDAATLASANTYADAGDVATLASANAYADAAVAAVPVPPLASVLVAGNSAGAKIVNLTDPTAAQDAATKFYVDTAIAAAPAKTWAAILAAGRLSGGVGNHPTLQGGDYLTSSVGQALVLRTQPFAPGPGDNILLTTGAVTGGTGSGDGSGSINLITGDGPSSLSGEILLASGSGNGLTGGIRIRTGQAAAGGGSGQINLETGNLTTPSNTSGQIRIRTGPATSSSGSLLLETGNAGGNVGSITMSSNTPTGGGGIAFRAASGTSAGGGFTFNAGSGSAGNGAVITFEGGGAVGGGISMQSGGGGVGGDITLHGNGGGTGGKITLRSTGGAPQVVVDINGTLTLAIDGTTLSSLASGRFLQWNGTRNVYTDVSAIIAAAQVTASAFRVVTGAGVTVTLTDADFPTAVDPRPVLIVLGATTTSVVVPVGLTQPVGAFVNFLQTTSQATFSVSGGAVLAVPLTTENKTGGVNTQQVLTSTANDSWVLGGRTSV